MSFNPTSEPGAFVPTTDVFETGDMQELVVQLRQVTNDLANVINIKDSGYYVETEFVNGQVWFPPTTPLSGATRTNRQVFRKVINFGILPNSTTKSVAHGINVTATFSFTRIYACATNPSTSFIPIPYINTTTPGDSVELDVDPTNVNITTTTANYTGYTKCYVILEYIKE